MFDQVITDYIQSETVIPIASLTTFDMLLIRILLCAVTVTAVFACLYFSFYFIKKTVRLIKK